MFVTNGREGNTFALLALTDPAASPRHKGMSCFIVEKGAAGLQVVKSIAKLGLQGRGHGRASLRRLPLPCGQSRGRRRGARLQARHVGTRDRPHQYRRARRRRRRRPRWRKPHARQPGRGRAACRDGPIAIRVDGARLLTYWAAGMKDRGERCDLEAGMAKLYASESAQEAAADAMRILGSPGQATAGIVERLYRDTPLMMIGEGTNEIQRTIIAKNLLQRHGERAGRAQVARVGAGGAKADGAGRPPARRARDRPGRRRRTIARRASPPPRSTSSASSGSSARRFHRRRAASASTAPRTRSSRKRSGRGSATVAAVLSNHLDAAEMILRLGTVEQRERLLPALASRRLRGGMLRRLRRAGDARAERGQSRRRLH